MKRPLVASLVAAGALAVGGVALAAGTLQYRAHPVGEFEVPATGSSAEAVVKLKINPDRTSVRYDLKITEPITDVLMAHLHMAAPGVNGPIVVWLYPSAPPAQLISGVTDGRLASGVITEANLTGPLAGNWEGFLAAIESGQIYANVHTLAHPGGEIRDQVHLHPDDD